MEQLKNCFFCGGAKVENWASRPRDSPRDVWCVFCHDCSCEGPEAATAEEAARLWNRRVGAWFRGDPKEPGLYWFRRSGQQRAYICLIERDEDDEEMLVVLRFGEEGGTPLEDWPVDGEWCEAEEPDGGEN